MKPQTLKIKEFVLPHPITLWACAYDGMLCAEWVYSDVESSIHNIKAWVVFGCMSFLDASNGSGLV